jgi:predicted O-methyltransferase YrrM
MRQALEYAYRYLYAVSGGIRLFTVGPFVPRHRRVLNDVARHFGYREPGAPDPVLPQVELAELVPADVCVQLREPVASDGNVTLYELLAIASITKHLAPAAAFEIGTYNGRTAVNIAANSPADSVTYTLDLPASGLADARLPLDPRELQFVQKPVSGELIASAGAGLRIEQLYGDSGTFDFSPYRGRTDLVFIDGSHSYEYVLNDSQRALEMLRPGGVALWHDYAGFPGVTRALNELYGRGGVWAGLRHIRHGSVVYLRPE